MRWAPDKLQPGVAAHQHQLEQSFVGFIGLTFTAYLHKSLLGGTLYLPVKSHWLEFLALLDCVSRANAVAQVSVVRPSSVKRVFSETIQQINAKFCGKVAIHHISRPFFPFLKILDF